MACLLDLRAIISFLVDFVLEHYYSVNESLLSHQPILKDDVDLLQLGKGVVRKELLQLNYHLIFFSLLYYRITIVPIDNFRAHQTSHTVRQYVNHVLRPSRHYGFCSVAYCQHW